MSEHDDTQPLDLSELLDLDKEEVAKAKRLLPDAATTRAAVVAVLLFSGAAVGHPGLEQQRWVDSVINAYMLVAPLALAWWIHRKHPKAQAPVEEHAGKHRAP